VPGDAARTERAQSTGIRIYRAAAGAGVQIHDGLPVFRIRKASFCEQKEAKKLHLMALAPGRSANE
jgi:hypothetical protein